MKGVMMKISAMLLVLWYCLSIIGFDVHTCSGSGEVFVAASFTDLDCENIHPEHAGEHHHCSCSHHHEDRESHGSCPCVTAAELHLHASDCCSDDYQVIFLTGLRSDDEHSHYNECHCGYCPCIEASASDLTTLFASCFKGKYRTIPDSGVSVPDAQALFNIWRI